jgi:predicted transcriptional regulator
MEIHFTPEIAAKLTQSAAEKGRSPDEFVQDVLAQYLDEEARFVEAVTRGEDALGRGDYLTHEQVGQRLQRFLRT